MKENDFVRRLKETKMTRWVRFGVVSVIYFAWVAWMQNAWLALVWLLLFDIYITGYIPLTWWKKSPNKGVRQVMSWVDSIVYALVLVYFLFAYVGQNYKIPSSSLEKSLLVGDYLWVNKMVYGPRVPQTPLHFPLAQHTLPILNCKSYIDQPQVEYHRLEGLRDVERNDIVVFNYPCGDTVALRIQNPDYYTIVNTLKHQGVENPRQYIADRPQEFGEVVWRPVDRRENYVKRCIGLPGERIKIVDDVVYINGKAIENADDVQFNYIIEVNGTIPRSMWEEVGVRIDDHGMAPQESVYDSRKFYDVPLTAKAKAIVEKWPQVVAPLRHERDFYDLSGDFTLFPGNDPYGWTRPNMGEIWIPKKGATLKLNAQNYPMYERAIRTYEGNDLEMRDGKIYINGKPTDSYTFKMDYYWMMGDNRDRSADSRYWGFVPEDHIVGTPILVLISIDDQKSLFEGSIRWDRIFRDANPYKNK